MQTVQRQVKLHVKKQTEEREGKNPVYLPVNNNNVLPPFCFRAQTSQTARLTTHLLLLYKLKLDQYDKERKRERERESACK